MLAVVESMRVGVTQGRLLLSPPRRPRGAHVAHSDRTSCTRGEVRYTGQTYRDGQRAESDKTQHLGPGT